MVGTEDITVGDGAVAQKGDEVAMSYVGTLEADGSRFDAGKDFRFTLGAGDVIKGWDRGIVGMRVGGRRKLVVPSKLGYGKKGSAPEIPPNATLLFDVTLERICNNLSQHFPVPLRRIPRAVRREERMQPPFQFQIPAPADVVAALAFYRTRARLLYIRQHIVHIGARLGFRPPRAEARHVERAEGVVRS